MTAQPHNFVFSVVVVKFAVNGNQAQKLFCAERKESLLVPLIKLLL